ncbi:sulfotransferase family protein [Neptuniibacter marinus]|uniref:sulfotransferase family protein n=1 Tax=Neptuniibacter marinus TaxID=1806670 RepID=UPI00082B0081|nr:sulfotransferase [Neptuniibacter marinus]
MNTSQTHIPERKNVFILGTAKRSGTNFLKNMLCIHEDCFSPGPIWEDFLLEHIDQLDNYVHYTSNRWNPNWKVEEQLHTQKSMKKALGTGLIRFLRSQLKTPEAQKKGINSDHVLITKTPSTESIDSFFEYFPNEYLIVITRDGRSVTESASKSFNKPQTIAMKEWNLYAEKTINIINSDLKTKKLLIVKYENLHKETEKELRRIINFLDLDEKSYNYSAIDNAPIIGSSDLAKKGELHWNPTKKTDSFQPNSRWEKWSNFKHSRYNWIAGESHKALGYEILNTKRLALVNTMLDLFWNPSFYIWYKVKKHLYSRKN